MVSRILELTLRKSVLLPVVLLAATYVSAARSDEGKTMALPEMAPLGAGAQPSATPTAVGQGYDTIIGFVRVGAVTGAVTTSGGADNPSSADITICEGSEDVRSALHINESASVSYAGFGSASQKLDLFRSLKLTKNSISVVVYARHIKSVETLLNPTLTGGAKNEANDIKSFVKKHGDSYVSSITLGGEFYAVYTFYTESAEEKQKVRAALDAKGVAGPIGASAHLSVAMDDASKSVNARTTFQAKLSGLLNYPPIDYAQTAAYALKFLGIPIDNPVVVDYGTSGYEDMLPAFDKVEDARTYFNGASFGVDPGVGQKLRDLGQLKQAVLDIRGIYNGYGGYDDPALDKRLADIQSDQNKIVQQIAQYEKNPESTFELPTLVSLDGKLPRLSFDVVEGPGHVGGDGGNPFDPISDVGGMQAFLTCRFHISNIHLWSGDHVDKMDVEYKDANGKTLVNSVGNGSPGEHWGDAGQIAFDAADTLSGVSGADDGVVGKLQLASVSGRNLSAGDSGDAWHKWGATPGRPIVALAGRAGGQVDQVRPVIVVFKPAMWVASE